MWPRVKKIPLKLLRQIRKWFINLQHYKGVKAINPTLTTRYANASGFSLTSMFLFYFFMFCNVKIVVNCYTQRLRLFAPISRLPLFLKPENSASSKSKNIVSTVLSILFGAIFYISIRYLFIITCIDSGDDVFAVNSVPLENNIMRAVVKRCT